MTPDINRPTIGALMEEDRKAEQVERLNGRNPSADHEPDPPEPAEEVPTESQPSIVRLAYRSTCLADVEPERVRWIWPGRLPAGKLVTLDGPPGVGKSTLILDTAATITRGDPLPGEELAALPASSVVIMSAEDGLADTIRPRLDAAGADVSRVHHLDSIPVYDDEGGELITRPPVIPDDLEALAALVTETGAVLVVVDVLMAYLSGKTNAHRDQDVRSALARLSAVAERTGACIVVLRHLRKAGGDAITAGGGSIGIIGAARAGLVVALDPDDETETRRICAVAKSNLAAKPPALAYTLTTVENGSAKVEWLGATAHTADQLVAPRDGTGERSKVDRAVDWLGRTLATGPVPWRQLKADAEAADLDRNALHRARERWGDALVIERDETARGRPSTWRLDLSSHDEMRRNPETKPDNALTREDTPAEGVSSQSLGPETKPKLGTRPCRDCDAPATDFSGLCPACIDRRAKR